MAAAPRHSPPLPVMKNHLAPKAFLLSIMVAATAVAQEPKITVPGQAGAPAAAAPAAEPAAPAYTDAQLLEEFGWYVGMKTGLSQLSLSPAEADQVAKGLLASLNGKETPYELQKIGPAMTEFIQKKQALIIQNIKMKNLGQAAAFFKKLKENPAVVELPDGLRYEVLKPGTGPAPKPTDTVTVNYTGTLIDGNVFDSSERTGKPAQFQLSQVIKGWTEGLQKSAKGGKIRLYVPPDLGYGDEGRPGIPPGSVLVFDVEVLDITSAPAAAPAAAPAPAGTP